MGIGGILPVTHHLHGITDSYLQIILPKALPTLLNPQLFDNKIKISICDDINIASHLKGIRQRETILLAQELNEAFDE
jgi:hypothetical protein